MSAFVLDASATLAWFFEDEASDAGWGLLAAAQEAGVWVPSLWALEVGNILLAAERRQRATTARIAAFVDELADMPINVDPETTARAMRDVLMLARAERLTTYDAAYLELAMRRGLPLATKDAALAAAARRLGVDVMAL